MKIFTLIPGAVLGLCSLTVSAQSLTDSLLIHYEFDGSAVDQSGNGFDGTINGATYTTDRNGNPTGAAYFDGSDDYIEFPNDPDLKPDLPLTFAFWVKIEGLQNTDNRFVSNNFTENNYHGAFMTTNNNAQPSAHFSAGLGGTTSSNRRSKLADSSLTVGQWHQVTAVIRGTQDMDIYIDCYNAGGIYHGTGSNTIGYDSNPGGIGRLDGDVNGPTTYFWGAMDDFMYWNRALDSAEVIQLCEEGGGGKPTAIDEPVQQQSITVYPNPSTSQTTVIFQPKGANDYRIDLYSVEGKLVRQERVISAPHVIEHSDLSKGVYIINLFESGIKIASEKLLIE